MCTASNAQESERVVALEAVALDCWRKASIGVAVDPEAEMAD
jgi:hypothetical protein